MKIASNRVVLIHYTLKNDAGETLDSSEGSEPLAYIHGNGNLIPGLEAELLGRIAGESLNVRIAPRDGYGDIDPALVQRVPRSAFASIDKIEVGTRFQTQTAQGPQVSVVTGVSDDSIQMDANHPLAGQHLTFAVEITNVREASHEEMAHGHVHGAGGHHH